MNAFAIKHLELQPADRVLEIGFGGGVTLPTLIAVAASVTGLDRSRDAVNLANARFSTAVKAGRAQFRVGVVESLPFDSGYFTKVCTVNTVYFWKSLDQAFRRDFPRSRPPRARRNRFSSQTVGWIECACRPTSSHPARPRKFAPHW
jgi:hypothetical protein